MSLALELVGVSVCRGAAAILHSVSFRVASGEFVGILGPNGAGKSTLLRVIAGLERFQGTLSLFGSLQKERRSRAMRLKVGYVPQSLDIDAAFPIRAEEAVMTGCFGRLGLFRRPGIEDREKARRLMEWVRVAHVARLPLGQLSGGERQKVSIARALMQAPALLLLDEPTAGLDLAVQKEVLDLVCAIREELGLTVVLVTHDVGMLPKPMERVLLLREGSVVFDGAVDEALASERLSALYDYPIETFVQGGRRYVSYD